MSVVLVHNASFRYEEDARGSLATKSAVRREFWWNLWQRRMQPYDLLSDRTPILLLNSWTERGGGAVITWLVTARDVHAAQFPDKNAAVRAIAGWAGETTGWVRSNGYTSVRPSSAGTVIFWRAEPEHRLDVLRPPGLRVRRNGWLVTDDRNLRTHGIDIAVSSKGSQGERSSGDGTAKQGSDSATRQSVGRSAGQGRRVDVATKDAIEQRAVTVAKSWCKRQGWSVIRDTGKTEPWDLEGVVSRKTRYAEVKGTTGGPEQVEVTAGEVKSAGEHRQDHVMLVVHGIDLDLTNPTAPRATGGTLKVFDPWLPRQSELTETRYTWRPGADR